MAPAPPAQTKESLGLSASCQIFSVKHADERAVLSDEASRRADMTPSASGGSRREGAMSTQDSIEA
eukprot:scaffold4229_cov30-Tisochrysis_lutea.AAC.6